MFYPNMQKKTSHVFDNMDLPDLTVTILTGSIYQMFFNLSREKRRNMITCEKHTKTWLEIK